MSDIAEQFQEQGAVLIDPSTLFSTGYAETLQQIWESRRHEHTGSFGKTDFDIRTAQKGHPVYDLICTANVQAQLERITRCTHFYLGNAVISSYEKERFGVHKDDEYDKWFHFTISYCLQAAEAGGRFLVYDDQANLTFEREQQTGDCILFNGRKWHEVEEVTAGRRAVLLVDFATDVTQFSSSYTLPPLRQLAA